MTITTIEKHPSHHFHTLFLNLTRPNDDLNTIPYLILLQYSSSLHLRLTSSDIAADSNSRQRSRKNEITADHIYKLAGVTHPSVLAQRDLCGSLMMKEAFRECIRLCDGFVILVSSTGWYDEDTFAKSSWVQNGIHIDLSLNTYDWEENHESSSTIHLDTVIEQKKYSKVRKIKACLDSLSSILSSIQEAVIIIHEKLKTEPNAVIKPIPIIFDSTSLLLRLNGPNKFLSFLNHLKQIHTINNLSNYTSPIFIPMMNETLSQSYIRLFEDSADATMTVHRGQLFIARRSTRSGGMFSSSLGPVGRKLVREAQTFDVDHEGNIQWNVFENDCDGETKAITSGINKSQVLSSAGSKESTLQSSIVRKNDKVLLQNDEGPRPSFHYSNDTKARIYMERDDPEFLDLDEDDPDDDLDL